MHFELEPTELAGATNTMIYYDALQHALCFWSLPLSDEILSRVRLVFRLSRAILLLQPVKTELLLIVERFANEEQKVMSYA